MIAQRLRRAALPPRSPHVWYGEQLANDTFLFNQLSQVKIKNRAPCLSTTTTPYHRKNPAS